MIFHLSLPSRKGRIQPSSFAGAFSVESDRSRRGRLKGDTYRSNLGVHDIGAFYICFLCSITSAPGPHILLSFLHLKPQPPRPQVGVFKHRFLLLLGYYKDSQSALSSYVAYQLINKFNYTIYSECEVTNLRFLPQKANIVTQPCSEQKLSVVQYCPSPKRLKCDSSEHEQMFLSLSAPVVQLIVKLECGGT